MGRRGVVLGTISLITINSNQSNTTKKNGQYAPAINTLCRFNNAQLKSVAYDF